MKTRGLATLLAGLALGAAALAEDPPGALLQASPVVGYRGHDAAAVWVAPVSTTSRLEIAWVASGRPGQERRRSFPERSPATQTATVVLDGLAPGTVYGYRVLVDGREDGTTAGSFRTGPEPGKPFRGRLAFASCMDVQHWKNQVAWTSLLADEPTLLLHLGDNVYSNSTDRAVQLPLHLRQRRVPEYARVLRSMPTLAIWDDHDFGTNDSDGTAPGKAESLETFRELWPNPGAGLPGTPGVFFKASWGDVDLFFTDGRYHRSPDWAPEDDPRKTMLGEAQFAWLERGLRESRATFKLVVSGSTIDGSFADYWGLYPRDHDRLLAITNEVPGLVFLTGDVHNATILRTKPRPGIGYPIYELVSSGIARNETRHHYVTLDVDTTAGDPTLEAHVRHVGNQGQLLGHQDRVIRASELRPAW